MKFSIIVPIYNVEKYIKRTIDSVLNQTYKNFELILIDDGSTDNSGKIIDEYKSIDKVFLFHTKNNGVSSARNLGVKKCNGDYIWFIDGDDYIEKNSLEILNDFLNKENLDILCFNYYNDLNGKITLQQIDNKYHEFMTFNPSVCLKVINTDFYKKNNLMFNNNKYEDLEFSSLLPLYTKSIKNINNHLYYYVVHEDSFIHSNKFDLKKDDIYLVLNRMKNKYKKQDIKTEEVEYIYIFHLLYSFSLNLLNYSRDIYETRIIKNINIINKEFPNWKNNFYYKKMSIKEKLIIFLLISKRFYLVKFMLKLKRLLKGG